MKSCTSCELISTCQSLCPTQKTAIRPSWTTSLRELAIGSVIDAVPSSQGHVPNNTPLPLFQPLRPLENKILEYFYVQGMTYKEISQRTRKPQNTVKVIIQRTKKKLYPYFLKEKGFNNGK